MQKKSFRLFISTLFLSLTVLVGGCGSSTYNETVDEPTTIEDSYIEPSRFIVESIKLPTSEDTQSNPVFDYSFIITDVETGKQYLYLYHDNGYDGGPVIVELGTIEDMTNNIDK